MKSLRTTTALVAGLAALIPTVVPAQEAQEAVETEIAACIAAGLADGQSEEEAREACMEAETGSEMPGKAKGRPDKAAKPKDGEMPMPPGKAEGMPEQAQDAPGQGDAATEGDNAPEEMTAEPEMKMPPTEESVPEAEAEAAPEAIPAPIPEAQDPEPETETVQPEAAPTEQETASEPEVAPLPEPEPVPETGTAEASETALPEEQAADSAAPEPEAPETEATEQAATEQKALEMTPEMAEAAAALAAALESNEEAETGAPVENEALMDDPAEATADTGTAAATEVQEEVITEETARSSDEDFSTTVTGQAAAAPTAEKDDGLSDVEKLAILGLGAIAVGALLKDGREVAVNSGDRVVVENPDGTYQVIKDDNALLRQPGSTIRTRSYADGSTRTITTKADGTQIVTVYDAQRRIVQRTRIEPDGTRYVLVDDSVGAEPVEVSTLPRAPMSVDATDEEALRAALAAQTGADRRFTLAQVRQISSVRALAPAISVETVTFATGSAAIRPDQARSLATLGTAIRDRIAENPREIFLIEGHTDAVGNAAYNLALSDRRAESLALALTEYFDVPPENLVVQGYGEQFLKVDTQAANEANRRASVRRITDLLKIASSN